METLRRHGLKLTAINAIGIISMLFVILIFYAICMVTILAGIDLTNLNDVDQAFEDSTGFFFVLFLIYIGVMLFIQSFYGAGIYKATARAVFEDDVSVSDFFSGGSRYWKKLLLYSLLLIPIFIIYGLVMMGITYPFMDTPLVKLIDFITIVLFILLTGAVSFGLIMIVQENVGPVKALKLSLQLLKKAPGSVLWTIFAIFLIYMGSSLVVALVGTILSFLFFDVSQMNEPSPGMFIFIFLLIVFAVLFIVTIIMVYQMNRYRNVLRFKLFGGNGYGGYTPPYHPPYNGVHNYGNYNQTPSQPNYPYGSGHQGQQNNPPNPNQYGAPQQGANQGYQQPGGYQPPQQSQAPNQNNNNMPNGFNVDPAKNNENNSDDLDDTGMFSFGNDDNKNK